MNKYAPLILVLVLCACTSTLKVAANFPAYFSSQEIKRDVHFGSKYSSTADIYIPDNAKTNNPVIVFFYGGAWKYGDKETYRFLAEAFTSRGYVVVIPDYIKYPKYKFPVWQQDAAEAVKWTYKNIGKYGGDNANIYLMGHSAGGQIAALLATDNRYGVRRYTRAFAGLAGPYDFTPEEPEYKDMFSTSGKNYRNMRVGSFIDGSQPPMLMLWGSDDETVGKENIEHVEKALKARGGKYKIKIYDDVSHVGIVGATAILARGNAPVVDDVDQWFKQYGKKK